MFADAFVMMTSSMVRFAAEDDDDEDEVELSEEYFWDAARY